MPVGWLLLVLLSVSSAVGQNLTVRSAASYAEEVAPGSLAALFGADLAPDPVAGQVDKALALPRELNGVVVEVDGRAAQLAYVSPGQINFVVPRFAAEGVVQVTVFVDGVVRATGSAQVARLAPGVFAANGSGAGAGTIFNAATGEGGPFLTQTAELPGCDKRTRLTLFASGLLFADNPDRLPLGTAPEAIEVILVDPVGVEYPAPVERVRSSDTFPGVDEVRFIVPQEAADSAELRVRILAEGIASNTVTAALAPAEAAALDCSSYGGAFVYNTVADLLAGDLWDTASPATVFADLSSAPGDWEVSGAGTTALDARNGEVIGAGFAGSPELVWADPDFPPTVRTLSVEPLAFVGVAAGNPASMVVSEAAPGEAIHQQILDLARANGLALAAIRVSGRFAPVSYSVAHNLRKEGTPLTDPAVDKAPFQLFFTAEESAEWELSGFYAAGAEMQEVVSVRGAPVHLHGFRLDRSRAGHIGSALVEDAEIRLYPLAPPTVREADLTLRNLVVDGRRVSFQALNSGGGTVSRTTVQGLTSGSVAFQVELSDLLSGEPREIVVDLSEEVAIRDLRVIVDPFNDVLESDESNNIHATVP